jgi:lysophospholipase L1-like esterase
MIGVNDVWRLRGEWNGQKFVTFAEYKANYIRLLDQAVAAGITRFFLASPSAIDDNKDPEVNGHLDERAGFVKELAAKYQGVYVPMRETQARALVEYPDVKWTSDGCHPTAAGHALLAQTWVKAAGL